MEKAEIANLYDTYSQDVYRLALSYLRNPQDAEDICHSVFSRPCGKRCTPVSRQRKGMAFKMHCQCLQKSFEILLEAECGRTP